MSFLTELLHTVGGKIKYRRKRVWITAVFLNYEIKV